VSKAGKAERTADARSQNSPRLPGFLQRVLETQTPFPHRLHLPSRPKRFEATWRQPPPPPASESLSPSLSPASWETKGLFIKRIVGGGGGGGGGGREGGIYKDKKRWEGGKERSCEASRGPELRWRPGSPGGCTVDPARPVGTRAIARACQELGRAAMMLPTCSPQAGNTIPSHRPGLTGAA
jgi:hypothetical protein